MHRQVQLLFETVRLFIREYEIKDISAVHEDASLAVVVQYANWGPNTLKDTELFFRDIQVSRPRLIYACCIELRHSLKQIGGCEIEIDSSEPSAATVGYIINPIYWNQGFATEAMVGLISFARNELGLQYLSATCDERNIASRRVVEKCGFKLDRLIEGDFVQKGFLRTTLLFTLDLNTSAFPIQ
ncbi:MAG: N-acetyltransferase [Chitinophagaceae bacterium]|nr:MAG: N-acetyltransferase [Chitinophagaceae bacterium]